VFIDEYSWNGRRWREIGGGDDKRCDFSAGARQLNMTSRRLQAALVVSAACGAGAAFAVQYANVCTSWIADIIVFEVYAAALLLIIMSLVIIGFRRFRVAGHACLAAVVLCGAFWGSAEALSATGHVRWQRATSREIPSTPR
jgi:hypothetical protein